MEMEKVLEDLGGSVLSSQLARGDADELLVSRDSGNIRSSIRSVNRVILISRRMLISHSSPKRSPTSVSHFPSSSSDLLLIPCIDSDASRSTRPILFPPFARSTTSSTRSARRGDTGEED